MQPLRDTSSLGTPSLEASSLETSCWLRVLMAAGAVGIVAALVLQLDLMMDGVAGRGLPSWFGIVVFSSFFTMWTNLLIAAVLLASAARPGGRRFLCSPRLKFALAPSIVLVGAVFALMLRNVYP